MFGCLTRIAAGLGAVMALSLALALPGRAGSDDVVAIAGSLAKGPDRLITIAEIEAMGLTEVTSFNPHDDVTATYSGIWLRDLVSTLADQSTTKVTLTAIDHYQVDFDRDEWQDLEIFLATREDGKLIEFEDRGPLRVIIADYDEQQRKHQDTIAKWVWMITEIDFSD